MRGELIFNAVGQLKYTKAFDAAVCWSLALSADVRAVDDIITTPGLELEENRPHAWNLGADVRRF